MKELIKPQKLKAGDVVATVSLSWGGAGDEEIIWRYRQGKKRMQDVFGLRVIEMEHTLCGSDFVYANPELRAADMMAAFRDQSVKAVIACIGGNDSCRMLPYIDYKVLAANPKIFLGYSDSTISHYICFKAGITSFYGPAVLTDFAENLKIPDYTAEGIFKALFSSEPVGRIDTSSIFSGERLEWIVENQFKPRLFKSNGGYELIQGSGRVCGRLIGGCMEVLSYMRGTEIFPAPKEFDKAILFLETSECTAPPWLVEDELRWFGMAGIISRLSGIVWGKPVDGIYYEEYKTAIRKVTAEFGRSDLPVLYNASFGHNEPRMILPFGVMAAIDCESRSFEMLESGVTD